MFDIKVNEDATQATIDAIKFFNWTILAVHKIPVVIEWKEEMDSDVLEVEYSVLDNMFIVKLNRKNPYNIPTESYHQDASISRTKSPGLFQLLIVEIRNVLAMAI